MAFLALQSLTKKYGEFVAVDNFSLSVTKGEFVCLLGPSGCGKTTTLQMVAGLVQPTTGKLELDGSDITKLRSNRRGLGIVFQSYALFPHMTVSQNVAFGLEMRGVPAAERTKRVADALGLVHLETFGSRYPRELSGGQRQRVALARAIVIQPPVMLLDEPMGALDAKLREEMQIELRALQRRLGITTIMVTHDQAEAMTLADRVVLMNRGEVEQVGNPYEMYERPNGRFSSTFLGRANVFSGSVSDDSFLVGDFALPAAPSAVKGKSDYIVRPEKIEFVEQNALVRGRVSARAFLGNHWLFQVETPLGIIQVACANTAQPSVDEGDEVGLRWNLDNARVVATEGQA
ncbi:MULTISPECIES: ABC transporter ATP-binding protein [unclassified Mesorhizobium]|uniref:ABC transporter ATP-binding protein n=1 Tax=unclassified Mesorhizobium TaxID=325217 RepID=UPI000FD1F01F|nr:MULTISPECIES: ABC transporter ATP-binding protein [unclassified Mesorhizobium]RUV97428.1 ABC transporter ATP-binding protein [Mesorhizobium sp. M5C.F.Ca.IN.020.14.1.1]RUV27857.1 ABC transporter ATP-binding protein [Mesorhizobium sp. M5C.F.Ca.IN.020.32.2.1]RWG50748.1 MAG: ABC transporter ATP-binding protein [Mesorhizobium sp.]RWH55720.1 MAG: ABC transporter ATP-binding protein [Mesorhizobium sp.]RWI67757.1 MAG: ABC transporter ATP-binding protein [Mesorhizobium sp.]